MIEEALLSKIKSKFSEYTKDFCSDNPMVNDNINMKIDHTQRVCIEILCIADSLNLSRKERYLAELIALLHDIGRFEQYRRYGTYRDAESEDHALLGVKIIRNNNLLSGILPATRELILRVIQNHNHASLPTDETHEGLFYLKLLRDADKLDIWRVVTDHYQKRGVQSGNGVELGLPETTDVSKEILADIVQGRNARLDDMKSINDLKLLQMSWIYDINFPKTFIIIEKRQFLKKIYSVLPQSKEISAAYNATLSYLKKNVTVLNNDKSGPTIGNEIPK